MNSKSVLDYLKMLVSGVLYHDLVFSEIVSLISGSGFEAKFFKLFTVRLKILVTQGLQVVKAKEFENIGQGLYSMHLTGTGFNIRILFAFLPNKQPVLLLAFYERGGKKNTDYSSHIGPALSRLSEMKEDYERG